MLVRSSQRIISEVMLSRPCVFPVFSLEMALLVSVSVIGVVVKDNVSVEGTRDLVGLW